MKKWAIFLICLVLLPAVSFADSGKNAVIALKKLEAKCKASVSYNDYISALGDALFEIDLYRESDEAKAAPALIQKIDSIVECYQIASTVWSEYIKYDWYNASITRDTSEKGTCAGFRIDHTEAGPGKERVFYSTAISLFWTEASNGLRDAMKLLAENQAKAEAEAKAKAKADSQNNPKTKKQRKK